MKRIIILPLFAALIAWPGLAAPHALAERTVPTAGATLVQPPQAVTIYFDAELEPVFSKLIVRNAQGVKVSPGNGEVVADNRKALTVRLPTVGKGAYRVYWNVVSHDGHRAQGEFGFTVR